MQGILYEEASILTFIFVTLMMGGLLAWMTGRACAKTWRPRLVLVIYVAILTVGVRFIHFSIFSGTLLSVQFYVIDLIVLEAVAFAAFQFTRVRQVATQYYWLYEATGPFTYRERA